MNNKSRKKHLLAVLLEDYFQVGAFDGLIQPHQWDRFESRFELNTIATLDLLDKYKANSTFFVLNWIAEKCPDLVKEITSRGHEIACYSYINIAHDNSNQLVNKLRQHREALEEITGSKVLGFRSAYRWSWQTAALTLDTLSKSGFKYDTSVVPRFADLRVSPQRRFINELQFDERKIWEFPVSTWKAPGLLIPMAGGNYIRQIPHTLIKRAVAKWDDEYTSPFIMYFHVWELDPRQPRISSASAVAKIRHYRNLDKMHWVINDYLSRYEFSGFSKYLGLDLEQHSDRTETIKQTPLRSLETISIETKLGHKASIASHKNNPRIPVSIIVPCFNEEQALPYLKNTLKSVRHKLGDEYDLRFVFVDDCSTDETWTLLNNIYGNEMNCDLVKHDVNKGVAAAIMTGIEKAKTEIVCSIDCDCTYDPHDLRHMIPLLQEDISMVTASPYHPDGKVLNVPEWRLLLSKTCSALYRLVLRQKLSTYTSCFRVYRKSHLKSISLKEGGFLGVAELVGILDLKGHKIVECPATLEVRLFGHSKMKLARTIKEHLKLLSRLLYKRLSKANVKAEEYVVTEATYKAKV